MTSHFQRMTIICGPHLRQTIRAAVVVGTVLFAINQLDVVLTGKATWVTWLKVMLTYLVPFLVANYGLLVASRRPPTARTVLGREHVTG